MFNKKVSKPGLIDGLFLPRFIAIPGLDSTGNLMIKLLVLSGARPLVHLFEKKSVIIGGRVPNVDSQADLLLSGKKLAAAHVKIEEEKERFVAFNLVADPCTTINGEPFSERPLRNGDIMKIDEIEILFGGRKDTNDSELLGTKEVALSASEMITHLAGVFTDRPVRLWEIREVLQGRWSMLFLVLLALPFCTPISLPGLSIPFGITIALIGFCLSLHKQPWLPKRLLDLELSPIFFSRVCSATQRLMRSMEIFLQPRWTFLSDIDILYRFYGGIIFICGALLSTPLPVPFSNILPAWTILLLSFGILERDGYFVITGLAMFALTLVFFSAMFFGGAVAANAFHQYLSFGSNVTELYVLEAKLFSATT